MLWQKAAIKNISYIDKSLSEIVFNFRQAFFNMNFIRKFLQWIVSSQLLISIGGGLYYLTGYMLLLSQFAFPWPRFIVIIGGTWLTYSTYRGILNLGRRTIVTVLLYSIFCLFLVFFIPFLEVLFLLHLAVLSFLYEPTSFVKINFFSLRKVPLLKLIILSYIWASISSYYPAINLDLSLFNRAVSNLFWIQFTFILSITIPFDIRDFYLDLKENLITMPRVFGFRASRFVSLTFLAIFTILVVNWNDNIYEILILSGLAAIIIWRSARRRTELYYGLWLDGLLILYFIIIYIHYHSIKFIPGDLYSILFNY